MSAAANSNDDVPVDPGAQPLALFDLDGTLTDPTAGIVASHRWALSEFDLAFPDDVDAASLVSMSATDAHAALGVSPDLIEETTAKFRERFAIASWLDDTPYDGIAELLSALKSAGWMLGVAATKLEIVAERVIERTELTPLFDVVAGTSPKRSRTDKRSVISHAIDKLDGTPNGIAVIGDRKLDIDAAKSLGMTAIGAAWGFGAIDELIAANADAVCLTPNDVHDTLLGD